MESMFADTGNQIPALELPSIIEGITIMFFSFLRVGGFLIASPIFGAPSIPLPVRIVISVVLGLVFLDQIDPQPILQADLFQLIKLIFVELFAGISMGLLLSILFASVSLAGEKIATAGGLGFAAQIDPTSGGQTPVISNIMTLFLVVIFLSLDGHLALVRALYQSHILFPLASNLTIINASKFAIDSAGEMFHIASIIMLPVVSILLLTNFSVGIITRSAPQLNLFSFGFPLTLMVTFGALYAYATPLGHALHDLTDFCIDFVGKYVTELHLGK